MKSWRKKDDFPAERCINQHSKPMNLKKTGGSTANDTFKTRDGNCGCQEEPRRNEAQRCGGSLEYIIKLARVKDVEFVDTFTPDKETASSLVKGGTLYIPLAGFIDFTDEIKRLEKEIAKLQKDFDLCDRKLNNPNFLEKAQPEVVEKEKSKHTELSENLAHLNARLAEINR